MAQEFIIKSQDIEDKINQLLPSQGGFQAGVDFSASTMVIPIVDLTETAEGSALRADLQTALSFTTATAFAVQNTTTTVVNTTGYWRIYASSTLTRSASCINSIKINDGTSDKTIWSHDIPDSGSTIYTSTQLVDVIVKLEAGHSLKIVSSSAATDFTGSVRQVADVNGNLINP
jgi:hypothetical protein